jgi:tetratricopeptide (TPR) repeat protein
MVGLFFKGSALGYRARLKVTRNFSATSLLDWPSVLTEGKEAYDIILQCQRMAPSNSDVLLGSGIYNYMAAYVPEKYPISKPFVSFLGPGDRQLGIQMLRISGQRAQYASVEAKYSLLEILTEFQKDYPAALEVAKELYAKYPGNPIFHKYLAKNYYLTNDYVDADSAWTEILRRVKRRESGYELTLARQGLYYLGDVLLRQGKYDDALRRFEEAVHQSERLGEDETSWIIMSELKIGYIYDLMGKRDEAVRQYKKVLAMDDYNSSRNNARKYLAEPYRN